MKSNITKLLSGAFVAPFIFLTSCGEKPEATNQSGIPSKATTGSEKSPPNEKVTVTLYTWDEYFDEETFAQFEKETGIAVNYATFESTDEMEAKLRSNPGKYDVIVADDAVLETAVDLKLVQELNKAWVPNMKNIDPVHLNKEFDPGNRYSAPYMWGTTLVAYRKDKVSNPEPSWDLLWDERVTGRVMVIDERFELLSLAKKFVCGFEMDSVDPRHFEQATSKIAELVEVVDAQFGSDADVREGLDSGEIWAAMCYSGDAALVASENENVGFYIPAEGAPLWMDSFAIVRDSNYPEEAHRLVNFMLEAKIAAANTNYTYYASPNKAAVPFIEAEILEDESIYPTEEVQNRCSLLAKEDGVHQELLHSSWMKIMKKRHERDALRKSTAKAGSDEPE